MWAIRAPKDRLPPTRYSTVEAVNMFRRFKISLGYSKPEPRLKIRVSASHGASKREVERVARQVSGIESNAHSYNDVPRKVKTDEPAIMGYVAQGAAAIEGFHTDMAEGAKAAKTALNVDHHKIAVFFNGFNATVLPLVAAYGIYAHDTNLWWLSALALTPKFLAQLSYWRHRLRRDIFQRAVEGHKEKFWKGDTDWVFVSRTYHLQANLINAVMEHGRDVEKLAPYLWSQDHFGYYGFFPRTLTLVVTQILDFFHELDFRNYMRWTPRQWFNWSIKHWWDNNKGAWVTVDRLIWREQPGGEPKMAVLLRTRMEWPKAPPPSRSK